MDGDSGSANSLVMSTYNGSSVVERLRILTDAADGIQVTGNVGIGTASPTAQLDIQSNMNASGVFTGSISTTTLTVTAVASGTIAVGDRITDASIEPNTVITALGTGTGTTGTYTVSISQTATSQTLRTTSHTKNLLLFKDIDTSQAGGTQLGTIEFEGSDSGNAGTKAFITAVTRSASSPAMLAFGTAPSGAVNAQTRMVIGDTGNVAIGTTDPSTSKLRVYNSTVSGNTRLHVHNDKNGDAAELRLEGKRTSNNDTGQLLYVNSGNVVARISANSSADDGDLRFYTSATGTGQNVVEAMRIATTGQVNIGETPALVDGTNNPRHVLHIGGTSVNPSYEQLSMSPGSNSGGENATRIRMANVGNDFYLTNDYYNWGTHRFDDTNEGQAFFKMGEDGRFSFGGRTSASTSSPVYNAGIGYDGSISAGSSSTMVNGLAKMNVVDRKSTRLNSSHVVRSRMPSSA
jgi:hypothetical protein